MIRNKQKLVRFYERLIVHEKISYKQALSLYEAFHREAVSLGVIHSKNILEGLEVDIRIARAIQSMNRD